MRVLPVGNRLEAHRIRQMLRDVVGGDGGNLGRRRFGLLHGRRKSRRADQDNDRKKRNHGRYGDEKMFHEMPPKMQRASLPFAG